MKERSAFNWLLVMLGAIALLTLLLGCGTQTRKETSGDLNRDERWTGSGSVGVPFQNEAGIGIKAVPFDFDVRREVTESTKESQDSKTTLQAPELAAAFATALRTSFPQLGALGALIGPPAIPSGLSTTEKTTLGGLAITLMGMFVQEKRRSTAATEAARAREEAAQQRQRADFHEADAKDAYARLPLPPPRADA